MGRNTIVHVVQHLRPGGIESLALEMQRRDPHCHIISLEGRRSDALLAWERLGVTADRLHFLDKPSGLSPRTVWRLVRLLRKLKAHIVHTHHVGPLLYGGLAARIAGGARLVHTEHDAWHLEDPRRAKVVGWAFRTLRPRIVADAGAVAECVRQKLGRQATIIRNGIDMDRFRGIDRDNARRQLGLPSESVVIGTAGRLEAVKNHRLLIDAFARCTAAPTARLAIAGDGSLRQDLEQLVSERGLENRVIFLGQVEAMPSFLSALDLFVLSSDREGYPLTLIEAQACDVPVIATRVGGVAEAVCPVSGQLVPAGDAEALAAAIEKALFNKPTASQSGAPRFFAEREGSLDVMIARYGALYAQGSTP
ncbi:MAG: glycosyltransferase [Alphaproteobacteria bacterium]|nr:glycosyltransferase [Alphaproteobacteria bacterium]